MALFDNGERKELLLFIQNSKIMLKALRMLASSKKLQYLLMLFFGEALHQFDTLCAQLGNTTTPHLSCIILGLGMYFFPVNPLSKQNRTMRRRMSKPHKLKVMRYAACLIYINNYFNFLPGAKSSVKIGDMEPNEIILNIIPN